MAVLLLAAFGSASRPDTIAPYARRNRDSDSHSSTATVVHTAAARRGSGLGRVADASDQLTARQLGVYRAPDRRRVAARARRSCVSNRIAPKRSSQGWLRHICLASVGLSMALGGWRAAVGSATGRRFSGLGAATEPHAAGLTSELAFSDLGWLTGDDRKRLLRLRVSDSRLASGLVRDLLKRLPFNRSLLASESALFCVLSFV
jgi:hypothetical protein